MKNGCERPVRRDEAVVVGEGRFTATPTGMARTGTSSSSPPCPIHHRPRPRRAARHLSSRPVCPSAHPPPSDTREERREKAEGGRREGQKERQEAE